LAAQVLKSRPVISQLSVIEVHKPAELIMRQIRNLISNGTLKAGDRLPSERELAERFRVGRGHVREALRKLEFHGVLQTFPQSGTTVASLGVAALERLISNLLELDRDDITALTETRVILEVHTAKLAAVRATDASIADIQAALDSSRLVIDAGGTGVEEDLLFHMAVSKAARNPILGSLIGLIAPDVIRINKGTGVCEEGRARIALAEHEAVFAAIVARDPREAELAMLAHMKMTLEQFSKSVPGSKAHLRGSRRA
jgi:GntR family transcriptional regulator, transcriptional repressor for pyruvate dehydrogenase complex